MPQTFNSDEYHMMETRPLVLPGGHTLLEDSMLIDTHCHLDMASYAPDLQQVLLRSRSQHIKRIITIGIDIESSKSAIDLARRHQHISATIGIHPHDTHNLKDRDYIALAELHQQNIEHIVAYGEIGLDYFKNHSDPTIQRDHFRRQLDIAHEMKLPIIVHNRDADNDILRLLRDSKPLDYGGIMHCFSGDYNFARKILDLGMLISIPGIVTFKNSLKLQEVARKIPLTSMVLETDGPFLAPQPFRGRRNEPAYLVHTAIKVAELRQIDINILARQTTANAEKLFSLTNG